MASPVPDSERSVCGWTAWHCPLGWSPADSDPPAATSSSSPFCAPASPNRAGPHNDSSRCLAPAGCLGRGSWCASQITETALPRPRPEPPAVPAWTPSLATCPAPRRPLVHPSGGLASVVPIGLEIQFKLLPVPGTILAVPASPPHSALLSSKLVSFLPQGCAHCCSLCPECSSHSALETSDSGSGQLAAVSGFPLRSPPSSGISLTCCAILFAVFPSKLEAQPPTRGPRSQPWCSLRCPHAWHVVRAGQMSSE